MSLYKEIVTNAIIGKGKKSFKNTYELKVDNNPDNVLGCWVINHKFEGYKANNKIGVKGSFDINLWYSYNNNQQTTVATKTIEYDELFNIAIKPDSNIDGDTNIIVRSLYQPNCSNATIDKDIIKFDIDKELGIEIVGETKVKIAIEEDEEPWEIIEDDYSDMEDQQIDNEVNEDYL